MGVAGESTFMTLSSTMRVVAMKIVWDTKIWSDARPNARKIRVAAVLLVSIARAIVAVDPLRAATRFPQIRTGLEIALGSQAVHMATRA